MGFYEFYVGSRITGFMSHWMTFGGEEMVVLLLLVSYLLSQSNGDLEKRGLVVRAATCPIDGAGLHAQHLSARLSAGPAVPVMVLEEMAGGGRAGSGADRVFPGAASSAGTNAVGGRAAWRNGLESSPGHFAWKPGSW